MATDHTLSRRKLLAATVAGAPFLLARRGAAASPLVLVELFTSQGCSSCPPADAFAHELSDDPRIIVLSFNVDYWDYLGWRDTLAKPEFSQRQYDYARTRGDGKVYTPQMVINGAQHVVGSNRESVREAIARARKPPAHITLTMSDKEIRAEISQFMPVGEATLWLLAVKHSVTQEITRGENTGKSVTYRNVVCNMVPAAMWRGEALKASWMKSAIMPARSNFCVAVLQEEMTGPVLAMART